MADFATVAIIRRPDDVAAEMREIRSNYSALVSSCDDQLGRLLDLFDQLDLWKDTCLVVTTDHGFLLAEREWWGKNRMPYFTEISRIPLTIWHPDHAESAGRRSSALTQPPDLLPTILELHGAPFTLEVLRVMDLAGPFDFTKDVQTLRIAARPDGVRPPGLHEAFDRGTRTEVFDLRTDPGQERPIDAPEIAARLLQAAIGHLAAHDAPREFYGHYGLDTKTSGRKSHEQSLEA
ncbi:sulfatase-like hydrolase/transferase [Sulfitobacter sp. LCG007]